MSTSVGVRPGAQVLVDRREPPSQPTFGHEYPSPIAGAVRTPQCNHDHSPHPNCSKSPRRHPRTEWVRCSLGMGALHFVAPKPFDTIIPAELPGSPGSTPTPPGWRSWQPARCCWRRAPGSSARWPRWRCLSRCSPPTSTWCGCGRDRQAVADADRRDRPAAAADSDDHRRRSRSIATPKLPVLQQRRPVRCASGRCPA